MPSINLDLDYFNHPKTRRLVGLLGRGSEVIPVRVWCFCGRHYSETGRLTGIAAQEIEQEVFWWGRPGEAVDALLACGFLKRDSDGTFIVHDWLEHSGHIARYKQRAKKAAAARYAKGGKCADAVIGDLSATSNAYSNATSSAYALPCKKQKEISLGEDSPELVAQEFWFYQTPKKDVEYDVAAEIREMVRVGWSLERIRAEVKADGRNRAEFWWQLVKRLEREAGRQTGPGPGVGQLSRVRAQEGSLAAISRKTIRATPQGTEGSPPSANGSQPGGNP